jgi:hypothetical protein
MTKTTIAEDPRIRELREKIKDDGYIQGAIQRIALVLSDRLIDVKETDHERQY